MATPSSTLAWRTPWTEEPGGLQFVGYQRIGHGWATNTRTPLSWHFPWTLNSTFFVKFFIIFNSKIFLMKTSYSSVQFSSVQSLSRVQFLATPWTATRPLPAPRVHSNPCPPSRWCHPAISSSVVPFSSCLQTFPASGSFPMSQLFAWGGQSIGVPASASVLPMNTQDWSPLGWTGWISLQFKGLSRIFSNTKVQKHQFFSAQLSL